MSAWVRTITVRGRQYLQVVETQPGGSMVVLRSFGQHSVENLLKARQYAASYNQLKELRQNPPVADRDVLLKAALAIFGAILGAAIIDELFEED